MKLSVRIVSILIVAAATVPAWSQSCQLRDEIPDAVKSAIENTAQQVFDQASRGDVNSLKANAIPSLQSNFSGITGAVNDNKPAMEGAKPQLRTSFFLDTGANPSADGRFYCGVFG